MVMYFQSKDHSPACSQKIELARGSTHTSEESAQNIRNSTLVLHESISFNFLEYLASN